VSFVRVEAPDRLRILIWERGVGPTTASGTGACGAAVAAAAHGGAAPDVEVISPGGSQRVEWRREDNNQIYLTGWARLVFEGRYIAVST
jgi:diaminopimelate epimerase